MTLQFSIGNALSRSFSIWLKNIVPFTVLAALVYAPVILYTAYAVSDLSPDNVQSRFASWVLVLFASGLILDIIASAVVIYGVIQHIRGEKAGIIDCLLVGLKRLPSVLGAGLTAGSLVFISAALIVAGYPLAGYLFLIPGLVVFIVFYVAVPVAVVERKGLIESLQRGKHLTDNYKVSIFGILFLLGILERLLTEVIDQVVMSGSPDIASIQIFLFSVLGLTIILGALGAVVTAVVYQDLRSLKDGIGPDDLANVFE